MTDIYILSETNSWKNGSQYLLQEMKRYHASTDIEWKSGTSHCPIFNKNFITINQSGNRQYCYNCNDPVNANNTLKYTRKHRLGLCRNCPVLLTCNGMCRIIDDDYVWKVACTRTFYFQLAYWIYYVHQTYGLMITSIEGVFLHNEEGSLKIAFK